MANKIKTFYKLKLPLGLFLLIIPATWALFVPGYFGASDDLHIAWLHQMDKIIKIGQIPPRFVPDLSFGFGYPLFNFVFPLPFYIAEIFHLLGLSFVDSIKALFFISVPLSGYFMYLLLKEFVSRNYALAGAALYIYTPYRAVDLYIRGAIGEVTTFIFLPLIVLSVIKLNSSTGFKWVGVGAIALSSLVLSHNITAYMFIPFVVLLLLMQFFVTTNKKSFFLKSFLMIFLSLLTSIYFWLPAILESGLVKYDTVFNFYDHFPTLRQLITPYWGYGASVPGPYDGMSFFLGSTNLGILLAGLYALIVFWAKFSREKRIILVWALICILSAVFLMNHRSAFLWENLPLLPYFQFPWRFLILTTFAIPIFIIGLEQFRLHKFIPWILIVLILITSALFFRPQDFLGRMDDYYLNRYIPSPTASQEYKQTQEEYLRLPVDAQRRPDQKYPVVFAESGEIKNAETKNDLHAVIEVDSKEGMSLNYTKYYFPGWIAKVDGEPTTITPGKPFGQIYLFVPKGAHSVEIAFRETSLKIILNAISLASFLVSLLLVKNLWFYSRKTGRSS